MAKRKQQIITKSLQYSVVLIKRNNNMGIKSFRKDREDFTERGIFTKLLKDK